MPKLTAPLFSFDARGTLSKTLTYLRRRKQHLVEDKPIPFDPKSASQLSWRHMFLKVVALWHALSAAEKQEWESLARSHHLTGYQWFVSQALRPNPGIYLPLQGGTMSGAIDMAKHHIEKLPAPVDDQDADTKAARNAAIAATLAGSLTVDIHGWDGSNWQKLLVESAAQHNLRVRLYDGAVGIDFTPVGSDSWALAPRVGMFTVSMLAMYATDALARAVYAAQGVGDTTAGINILPTGLYGFSGTVWQRLRTYGVGIQKVGRAEVGLDTLRRTNTGQVKASAGKLYWITMNPTAANSVIELTDDLNGLGAVVWDMTHGVNAAHHMNLDPPMEFTNGIYLKTLTNFTSVIFGFL